MADEHASPFLVLELHALKDCGFRVFSHRGVLADVESSASERLATYFHVLTAAEGFYEATHDLALDEGLSACVLVGRELCSPKAQVSYLAGSSSSSSRLPPVVAELVERLYAAATDHVLASLGSDTRCSETELERARTALARIELALSTDVRVLLLV